MRRTWPLILAAALAAGCGNDGDEDEAAPPAQTTIPTVAPTTGATTQPKAVPARPSAFSRKADQICTTYQRRIDRLPRPRNPGQVTRFLERSIALAREEVNRLAQLRPPPAQAAKARQLIVQLRAVVRGLQKLASATTTGDQQAAQAAIQESSAAAAAARTLGAELGITACGQRSQ